MQQYRKDLMKLKTDLKKQVALAMLAGLVAGSVDLQ